MVVKHEVPTMRPTIQEFGIDKLSASDRSGPMHEISDSLSVREFETELSEDFKAELDARCQRYQMNPETART